MRKTCCSNLRQGNCFQASLSGSSFSLTLGAFLSAIVLDLLLSIQLCPRQPLPWLSQRRLLLGQSFRRAACGWHLLTVSTLHESTHAVTPLRFSVFLVRETVVDVIVTAHPPCCHGLERTDRTIEANFVRFEHLFVFPASDHIPERPSAPTYQACFLQKAPQRS